MVNEVNQFVQHCLRWFLHSNVSMINQWRNQPDNLVMLRKF
jgi:hypothetical protein